MSTQPKNPPQLIDAAEARRRLGDIRRMTLHRYCREGILPFVKDARGWRWFAVNQVQDLAARRQSPPSS